MVKLEAAGNDFLVMLNVGTFFELLDDGAVSSSSGSVSLTADRVRALCDRRRGVGADGLIVGRVAGRRSGAVAETSGTHGADAGAVGAEQPAADLEMSLFNADGSRAEMSGNGIRCLVHAAVEAGVVGGPVVRVMTAAGLRTVSYDPGQGGVAWARVEMGPVQLGRELPSPLARTRARLADVGNPHLVIVGDVTLDALDLDVLGVAAVRAAGGPVNVEVVRPGRSGADLDLRVLERGVGETLACGTGTCAAAAVARSFGLVGHVVSVDNPGGRLEVSLGRSTDGRSGVAADSSEVQQVAVVTEDSAPPVVTDAAAPPVVTEDASVVDAVELGGPVRKVADVWIDPAFLRRAGERR
ncbi:MAG: diaminopimelate epimerase [Actinomycetota bacterium]|jgi:diaminopimelate epimerase|nr:diaminopimelate epimerase [Actinomycetota bacterium]